MDFLAQEVGVPTRCPDCDGAGHKPYPFTVYCSRCGGTGYIIKVLLTYGEEYNTSGIPSRQMFAGYIERPYSRQLWKALI